MVQLLFQSLRACSLTRGALPYSVCIIWRGPRRQTVHHLADHAPGGSRPLLRCCAHWQCGVSGSEARCAAEMAIVWNPGLSSLPQPWPQCPFACILERFEASCSSWESGRRPRSTRTVASLSVVGSGTQCVSAGPRSGQLGGLRRRRRLHVARADQVLLRQPDGSSRPRCTDR
jgi:hypothetical protein